MTVHIERIQVKNLGPIASLQADLGRVNLFYGHNESGKTYLVEFLLSSLFRQARDWELRQGLGAGSVAVSGLGDELVSFHPESSRKLESFWDENGAGLPLNLARLLVVKGGELDLAGNAPGGVDRDTLRAVLTSQALLDQIGDEISATVRGASLVDGGIEGSNRGLIKRRSETTQEVAELEKLLEAIEAGYSQGPARELERKLTSAQGKLDQQVQAKRALAYQTNQELAALKKARGALNEKELQDLRDAIRDLDGQNNDIRSLEDKVSRDLTASQDYRWLDQALEVWQEKGLEGKRRPLRWLGIAGLALLGSGACLLILERFFPDPILAYIAGGMAVAGFGLSLYFGIKLIQWSDNLEDSRERESIRREYQEKFQSPLRGLIDLKTRKSQLHEIHLSAQTRQDLLDEKTHQRDLLRQTIAQSFLSLQGEAAAEADWKPALAALTQASEELNEKILGARIQLEKLDVPESDYHQGTPNTAYDPAVVQDLEGQIQEYEKRLAEQRTDLDTLKARVCERTGDEVKDPWPEVLFNLQTLLEEKIQTLKGHTAELVAKIGLTEVLDRLREAEDQKILQALNTDSLARLLKQVTGRYQVLDLVDDQLFVEDSYSRYALRDLSTGAREQVQLTLRLGLAAQISGGRPLFLILDDAFQHSDWQRREALVESALHLAEGGWQILYFSMDDHIRDLFLAMSQSALQEECQLIALD